MQIIEANYQKMAKMYLMNVDLKAKGRICFRSCPYRCQKINL